MWRDANTGGSAGLSINVIRQRDGGVHFVHSGFLNFLIILLHIFITIVCILR